MSELLKKGLKAKRESKYIDFKSFFDPNSPGDWCEIIKDIVAMANSGGGVILIGLDNSGRPTGEDVSEVLKIDHATLVDKISKYTGHVFSDIELHEANKEGHVIAIIETTGVAMPMVFEKVGTYQISQKKQKTAFSRGTLYFRHGAKSEPATTDDIRAIISKNLEIVRKEWIEGVRKVVKAPQGSTISVFKGEVQESKDPSATPIRIVNDEDAPGYKLIDYDKTYPYRQKELINVVNGRLPSEININQYDIQCIRCKYKIDENRTYSYKPKFAVTQYNEAFAEWMIKMYRNDNGFFKNARSFYYRHKYENS